MKREVFYGNSRFDIYFETSREKGFIEVKGVTLENNGIAMFPDAPTKRGTKHVKEMARAVQEGLCRVYIFLIQIKGVKSFTPNKNMDLEFASALKYAVSKGVKVLAYDTFVTKVEIVVGDKVIYQL